MVVLSLITKDNLFAPSVFQRFSPIDGKMIGNLRFLLMRRRLLLFMNHNLMVTIVYTMKSALFILLSLVLESMSLEAEECRWEIVSTV